MLLFWIIMGSIFVVLLSIFFCDRFFQTKNLVLGNFPLLGRFRYFFHNLRPFFRQYFGDDNAFAPRILIEWILSVSAGKTGYFSFDKLDDTHHLDDNNRRMIHAPSPKNTDEMNPVFPILGKKRPQPMQWHSYIYRSAMSLGALGFEATSAMAAGCVIAKAPFNTGEGGFSLHHIPNIPFSPEKKYFKSVSISKFWRILFLLAVGPRLRGYAIDFLALLFLPKGHADLYRFDAKHFVFYAFNWDAPLSDFPKTLPDGAGDIIFQIGSGLYGLRSKTKDGSFAFDWDRFQKIASFCRAFEVKLGQGAKQTGGILKKNKNTPVIADIRGVHSGIDLISPNRFPFYEVGDEKGFFDFLEQLSKKSGGKPVGCKIVISNEKNIEPFAKELAKNPKRGPDFFTIDGGDGGSGAAPIALSILFGKRIFPALEVVTTILKKYGVRDQVSILASSKLLTPERSARALAMGADAIGNARAIMIAGGCIRAGQCSGENGTCPVGLATMKKSRRRAYAQVWKEKSRGVARYITAHNHGIVQVAAICGVKSPSEINSRHVEQEKNTQ